MTCSKIRGALGAVDDSLGGLVLVGREVRLPAAGARGLRAAALDARQLQLVHHDACNRRHSTSFATRQRGFWIIVRQSSAAPWQVISACALLFLLRKYFPASR